jgi:predicted MFS family arabinose efflux permease
MVSPAAEAGLMGHPWRPTATVFFVNGAVFGVWATQIPLAKDRLGLDPAVLGIMLLILGAGAVAAMVSSGYLIRRFGTAPLIRWSGALFCVLLPILTVVPNVPALAVALALFGAGGGSMDVAMNAHASAVEKAAGRPYMSSFHGMWSLGGLSGALIGGGLLAVVSGPAQAFIAALLLGALLLLAWSHLEEREEASPDAHHASLRPEGTAILIGILAGLCFASEGAVLDWSSIYMRTELGAATETAAAGYAAFSGTMAIGRFLGDWVRSHIGATLIVRAGAALAIFGMLLGPVTGSPVLAVIGFGIAGIGLSNVVPVLISAAGASDNPEIAIATVATLGYAGLLSAPPLLGFVAHASSLATTFGVVAVMCLIIGLGAVMARRANLAAR